MAFLHNKILRRVVLTILAFWSAGSFWFFSPSIFVNSIITFIAAASLYLIWTEIAPLFLLIFLSFSSAYALYGFIFVLNLPLWLGIIAALLIFGYLFTFFEQKVEVLIPERLIYLLLFDLIIAESFIFLSYFLIDPLNRSLLLALIAYILAGFCLTIIEKKQIKPFFLYLIIFGIVYLLVVLTSAFGA